MDCNNVSMVIQCHKFGTLEQWIVQDSMTSCAHHLWYVEDGESHTDVQILLKACGGKKQVRNGSMYTVLTWSEFRPNMYQAFMVNGHYTKYE